MTALHLNVAVDVGGRPGEPLVGSGVFVGVGVLVGVGEGVLVGTGEEVVIGVLVGGGVVGVAVGSTRANQTFTRAR